MQRAKTNIRSEGVGSKHNGSGRVHLCSLFMYRDSSEYT